MVQGIPTLEELEQNPVFAKLPYEEQLNLRSSWFSAFLEQNADAAQNVNPELLLQAKTAIIQRPPVFEGNFSEYGRSRMELIQKLRDPNSGFTPVDIGLMAAGEAFVGSAGILGWIMRRLEDLGEIPYQYLGGKPDLDSYWFDVKKPKTPDDIKASQYFTVELLNRPEFKSGAAVGEVIGTMGGKAVDLLIGNLAVAGVWGKLFGAATSALAGSALTKTPFGRWLATSALPAAIRNSKDGLIGVASDFMAMNHMDPDSMPKDFLGGIGWATSTFGTYFAMDMLVFTGLETLKTGLKMLKISFGRGFTKGDLADAISKLDLDNQKKLISDLLYADDMPTDVLAGLPKDAAERLVRLNLSFKALRGVAKTGKVTEDMLDTWAALKSGYILEPVEDGFKLFSITDDTYVGGTFGTSSSAIKWIYKQAGQEAPSLSALPVDPHNAKPIVQFAREIKVEHPLESKIILAREILPQLKIKGLPGVDATDMDTLTQFGNTIQQWATKQKVPIKVEIVDAKWYFGKEANKRLVEQSVDTLYIPKEVPNVKRFLTTFSRNLAGIFNEDPKTMRSLVNVLKEGFKPVYDEDLLQVMAANRFPGATLKKLGSDADGWELQFGDGKALQFSDATEVGRFLFKMDLPEQQVKNLKLYMKNKLNLDLEESQGGGYLVRQGKDIVIQVPSRDELLKEVYERGWIPGLPSELAPPGLIITNRTQLPGGEARVITQMEVPLIVGDARTVTEKLAKFVNMSEKLIDKQIKDIPLKGMDVLQRTDHYVVRLLDTGAELKFGSLEEAIEATKKLVNDVDSVLVSANVKGFYAAPAHGKWILKDMMNPESPAHIFNDVKSLKEYLKSVKLPEAVGQELSGLPEDVLTSFFKGNEDLLAEVKTLKASALAPFSEFDLNQVVDQHYMVGPTEGEVSKIRTATTIKGLLSPVDYYVQSLAKDLNRPDIYEAYKQFRNAANRTEGMINRGRAILQGLGREVTKKEKIYAVNLLGADPTTWEGIAKQMGFELTPQLKNYVLGLRHVYDELSKVFGIDSMSYLRDYVPRLKQFVLDKVKDWEPTEYALSKLAKEYGNNIPKEIRFLSKNMRVKDLVQFVENLDAESMTLAYMRQGYKSLLMDTPYKAMKEVAKEVFQIDTVQGQRLIRYMEHVIGSDIDLEGAFLKKASQQASEVFFQKLGKIFKSETLSNAEIGDILSFLNELMVSSTMSFRPVLVLRNLVQPFATVAPRIGVRPVVRAMKRAVKLDGEEVAKILEDLGETLSASDIYPGRAKTVVGQFRLTQYGMKAYKNADEFNRVVTYLAAKEHFDDAVAKWTKLDQATGTRFINEKQFLELSGLKYMDKTDQASILTTLKNKGPGPALIEFAQKLIHETQFPYKGAENPMIFNGLWGRLFGAYGTYPAFYLTNIMRGLGNGGLKGALEFGGRLALVSAALYVSFEKVMGIPATAFLPWGQATFDGGPFYKTLNNTLTALTPGPYSKEAWERLKRDWSRILIPGSTQFRSVMGALEAAERGDTYEAIVRLLGSSYIGKD